MRSLPQFGEEGVRLFHLLYQKYSIKHEASVVVTAEAFFHKTQTQIKMKKAILISGVIIIILLLPLLFKKKGNLPLNGPDLSEFQYREISFVNKVENINLAGMLMLPETSEPYPITVLIHGSGTSRRNSVWYLSVVKHLNQNGIGVLLPDKRGSEKSEGKWVGANFDQLANDAVAAVNYIKKIQH